MYPTGNFNPQGIPARGYPMMPQANPQMVMGMMRPGIGFPPQPMGQPGMFPPQMNPGMVPVSQPMRFMPPSGSRPPPPSYTPEMQKNFQQKTEKMIRDQHKQLEEQRKHYERQLKQQQFQEQQKRLKEFSTTGGRKMDADSLIQSIVGPSDRSSSRPTAQSSVPAPVPASRPQPPVETIENDDGFGDFFGGPSPQITISEQPPVTSASITTQQTSVTPAQPVTQTITQTTAPPVQGHQERPPEEKKADLASMMMQCSDFSAPKEAKSFVKKVSVKDVTVSKKQTASYKESQRARRWDADTNTLSELFTNDEGVAPTSVLPKWITGDAPVPDVYNMILEASLKDGKIDTSLLYPILLRSGLSREKLGHIWQLCNKQVAGVLMKEELFCVLALISVAQNNIPFENLSILRKCVHAPVPNFGVEVAPTSSPPAQPSPVTMTTAAEPQTTFSMTTVSSQPVSVSSIESTVPPAGHIQPPTMPSTVTVHPAVKPASESLSNQTNAASVSPSGNSGDDDFADFQTAGALPPTASSSFADFSSIPNSNSGLSHIPAGVQSIMKPNASAPDLIGEGDKYSAFREAMASDSAVDLSSDDFGDFKSDATLDNATNLNSIATSRADTSSLNPAQPSVQGASLPPPPSNKTGLQQSSPQTTTVSSSQSPTLNSDDFADFQQARGSEKTVSGDDKYASLKALVMNKTLYEKKSDEKPPEGSTGLPIECEDDKSGKHDDWAGFTSSTDPATDSTEKDGWADFESKPPATSAPTADWSAAFDQPKQSEIQPKDVMSDSDSSSGNNSEKIKVDNSKANKLFSHNLKSTKSANIGISPLDMLPPDLPPDDMTPHDDFDQFGTFQGSSNVLDCPTGDDGISSIALSGLDISDLPPVSGSSRYQKNTFGFSQGGSISKSSTRDTFDTQSNSSLDFTITKNQKISATDTTSMGSYDFKESKDLSSVAGDSISVSSLEMPHSVSDMSLKARVKPPDEQSVASLELKTASSDVELQSQMYQETDIDQKVMEDDDDDKDFGEFSSASKSQPEQLKPRDASELLTCGDMPNLTDRYRGLTNELEDSELHSHSWHRCLEKCLEVIQQACDIINSIPTPSLLSEIIQSQRGSAYFKSVTEVYRVACRIKQAMNATSLSNKQLEDLVLNIESSWGTLTVFIASTHIMPPASTLSFHKHVLHSEEEGAQEKACGVCILNVDHQGAGPSDNGTSHKLTYGGRQYHTVCANFWVNCVDSMLPALKIPELI